jgi:hypothetical protein
VETIPCTCSLIERTKTRKVTYRVGMTWLKLTSLRKGLTLLRLATLLLDMDLVTCPTHRWRRAHGQRSALIPITT